LSVSRSHKHIGVQIIDDVDGRTLASASTQEKEVARKIKYGGNQDAATEIGRIIAERASKIEVTHVCFDRGAFKYHGRVAALAEAAREAGLSF
jgi:large subunit ribosomal protein L18